LQRFGGGGGGGVVTSLQSPSMFPLSIQIIESCILGIGVHPTGTLHSDPV